MFDLPKVGSRGVKFACRKHYVFYVVNLRDFFFKRFVRLYMMYKSFWMLLGRSSGFCRQSTSRGTLSRSHFTLFTCTAWLNVSQICLHKTFTSIHMSSMFDERSPIFPRFHSPSLLSSTSFLPTPTSTTSPSDNRETITRNEELCAHWPHSNLSQFWVVFNLFFLLLVEVETVSRFAISVAK